MLPARTKLANLLLLLRSAAPAPTLDLEAAAPLQGEIHDLVVKVGAEGDISAPREASEVMVVEPPEEEDHEGGFIQQGEGQPGPTLRLLAPTKATVIRMTWRCARSGESHPTSLALWRFLG